MYCTVHIIITVFNVAYVLMCVTYQLHFTVFMYVTRIYSVWYYTCSSSGGAKRIALGILRACYVSWLYHSNPGAAN
jgi:hypothetical protein